MYFPLFCLLFSLKLIAHFFASILLYFSNQIQLTAKKKYEDEKDFDDKLAKATKKKANHESQLEEAEETEEKLLSEVSEIKAKLADAEATMKQAMETEQEKEEAVRDARNALKEAESDFNKVSFNNDVFSSEQLFQSCFIAHSIPILS